MSQVGIDVVGFDFLKGHGTENDFVLLPDPDGSRFGDLDPALVRRLCDRRAGLGADGVLRVVRTEAYDDPSARAARGSAVWFMDYRNADGSTSEMCGNGVRVFGRYLVAHQGVDAGQPLPVGTRDGVKVLSFPDGPDGPVSVDMGEPDVLGETEVSVGAAPGRRCTCRWATRTRWHSWTRSTTPGRCSTPPSTTRPSIRTASMSSSWCAETPGTWRCACTSAARGRRAPAAPVRAR